MADGVKVSRGNPRSSSVGEEEDVREVHYRSTTAIDSSSIVDIVPCGFEDPCADLDLSFYNVMGQEDRFRQVNGRRVNRGGTARIVFTVGEDVKIDKIEYDFNPVDEDNPVFDQEWNPTPPAKKRHEVFVNVSPDVLYAFKITVSVEDCPDTNTSDIYYFATGDTITLDPEEMLSTEQSTSGYNINVTFSIDVFDYFSIIKSSSPSNESLSIFSLSNEESIYPITQSTNVLDPTGNNFSSTFLSATVQ